MIALQELRLRPLNTVQDSPLMELVTWISFLLYLG
jgi:hypothetical protein